MSSSYIEFKNNGYWIADGFNEIIARYIVENLDAVKNKPQWAREMRDKIFDIAQSHFTGWNNFGFDTFLIDEVRVTYFIEVLDKTILFLKKKGDLIKKQELNSYEVPKHLKSEWTKDIDTMEIVTLIEKIKDLLSGSKIDN